MAGTVRAAGGVVFRTGAHGDVEVLLVHRPHRADWTFPKGKALPGESDERCALREVEEETGLRCTLEAELLGTSYRDDQGRQKLVRYWVMRPLGGVAAARNEVDAVRWAPIASATEILTYAGDRAVLTAFALRHAVLE